MPPAFSFGTSQRGNPKTSNQEAPGPGEYSGERFFNNKPPTWRIGSQNRVKEYTNEVPGPGSYETTLTHKRHFPKYQFGLKIASNDLNKGLTPGPGAYDPKVQTVLKLNSQYTFGLKLKRGGPYEVLKEASQGTGPGGYETNYSTLIQRPSSKIGRTLRGEEITQQNFTPGVGQYEVRPSTSGPFYRFGSGQRDSGFALLDQTPGPGQYMINSMMRTTQSGKTMSYKTQQIQEDRVLVPGPGTYEPYVEQIKQGQPKYRIGTGKRKKLNNTDESVPGPGAYQPSSVDKKHMPAYKIGSEQRGNILDQETPGPGAYDPQKAQSQGKQYTMRLKTYFKDHEQKPGPQTYYPDLGMSQVKNRPASTKIGKELRDQTNLTSNTLNPGPDHYQINDTQNGPKYPFGSEPRGKVQIEQNPGPGAYEIPQIIGNTSGFVNTSLQKTFFQNTTKN